MMGAVRNDEQGLGTYSPRARVGGLLYLAGLGPDGS